MVSLERMRNLYKDYNYTDQQLLAIRAFLYSIAEMQTMLS